MALAFNFVFAATLMMSLRMSTSLQIYINLRHYINTCERLDQLCHGRKHNETTVRCVTNYDETNGPQNMHKVDIIVVKHARAVWFTLQLTDTSGFQSQEQFPEPDKGLHLLLGVPGRVNGGQLRLFSRNNNPVFKDIGGRPWRAFVFSARTKDLLVGRSQSIERHSLHKGVPSTTIVSSIGANDFAIDEDRFLVFFIGTGAGCLVHRMTPFGKKMRCMDKIKSVSKPSGCRLAADVIRKWLYITLPRKLIMTDYEGTYVQQIPPRVESLKGISVDSIEGAMYYGDKAFGTFSRYMITKRKFVKDKLLLPEWITSSPKPPNKIVVLKKKVFFTVFGDSRIYSAPVNTTCCAIPVSTDSGFEPKADVWMNLISFYKDVE